MNHLGKISFKYDVDLQIALHEFMGSFENVYDTFILKLSDKEKIKINEFKKRRTNYFKNN
jgi:hypothetical protein